MSLRKSATVGTIIAGMLLGGFVWHSRRVLAAPSGEDEIRAFNQKYIEAHLKMDTSAIIDTWAEDGVTLLPETPPMRGKVAIAKLLTDVMAQMVGYKVTVQEVDFEGILVNGDWASEWGLTHQVVQPPDGKPLIDGRGKILLVLHRDAHGQWKVEREMWNAAAKQ